MKWKSKWPIYAGILILVIFVIYGFVIWWSFEDGGDRGTFGDMFGAVNALFSGLAFAGVLYTINLQRRDSSLNIMPLLSVDTVREGRDLRLEVVNIGNGTAINIGFSDAVLEGGIFEFKVEDIRYLKPGDKVVMAITTYGGGVEMDEHWTAHLDRDYANRIVPLTVTFQDVEYNQFEQKFELGIGDRRITMLSRTRS